MVKVVNVRINKKDESGDYDGWTNFEADGGYVAALIAAQDSRIPLTMGGGVYVIEDIAWTVGDEEDHLDLEVRERRR